MFARDAAELIGVLRQKSPQQIASLMQLSDALATLNVARYEAWRARATARNAKQAALAFNGDVYDGNWDADKKIGEGIYKTSDGLKYEGMFSDGFANGTVNGTLTSQSDVTRGRYAVFDGVRAE